MGKDVQGEKGQGQNSSPCVLAQSFPPTCTLDLEVTLAITGTSGLPSALLGRKTVKTSRKTSWSRYRTEATHENFPRKMTTFLPDSYRQWPYLPGRGPKTRQMLPGDSSQIFFTQLLEKSTEKMNPWPSFLSSTDLGFPTSAWIPEPAHTTPVTMSRMTNLRLSLILWRMG